MKSDNAGGGLRGLRATLSPELLEVVRDYYGLGSVNRIVDLGGSSNLNLLVDDGNLRHVVRVYRPYVTEARLRALQLVRRELAAGNVPCPAPLPTRDGQPWVALNGRLVEVEYYVEHNAKMDSWERLETALPMLGCIHTLLQDVRIDDVALTLYFTSLKYAETAASDAQLWRLRRLIDVYDSGLATPLSSAERAALPLALARQPLWSIGGWVALLDDQQSARQHAAGTVWAVEWALGILGELDKWQLAFA